MGCSSAANFPSDIGKYNLFSVPDICFNYLPVSILFLCSFLQFYWLLLYLYMLVFFGTVSHPAQADLKLSVGEDDLGLLTLLPVPPKC